MSTPSQTMSPSHRITAGSARFALFLLRARAAVVLVALLLLFTILTPSFLTADNLSILAKQVAISALLAIGMTFTILTGGIDLSVGSIVGLSGMVAGYFITRGIPLGGAAHYPPIVVVVLLTILVCLLVGALNGWLVVGAGVTPFIATLGTLYIARGAALLISNGETFAGLAGTAAHGNTGFTRIGQSFLLHVPTPVWMMAAAFLLTAFIASRTPFGRHVYAIGGNERAARLAGVCVARVKALTYIFSAFWAALVGLVIASQLESAHPATGNGFELNAIAAVVLGGTSLFGGRGSITGSLVGAFVIGVLADGLVLMGVSEFWQTVFKGVVIVLAVAIDELQTRLQNRLLPVLGNDAAEESLG